MKLWPACFVWMYHSLIKARLMTELCVTFTDRGWLRVEILLFARALSCNYNISLRNVLQPSIRNSLNTSVKFSGYWSVEETSIRSQHRHSFIVVVNETHSEAAELPVIDHGRHTAVEPRLNYTVDDIHLLPKITTRTSNQNLEVHDVSTFRYDHYWWTRLCVPKCPKRVSPKRVRKTIRIPVLFQPSSLSTYLPGVSYRSLDGLSTLLWDEDELWP